MLKRIPKSKKLEVRVRISTHYKDDKLGWKRWAKLIAWETEMALAAFRKTGSKRPDGRTCLK
jgi:hypothetical protein